MKKLQDVLKGAMDTQNLSIRAVEKEISTRLGEEHRVSRNLIHEYLRGKRAPTYEACLALASVLEIDAKDLLIMTYFERQQHRINTERERFLSFCKKKGIDVSDVPLSYPPARKG